MIEPWTQTYNKIKFDFINPTTDMINIGDISQGLAMQCRFSGQCKEFYSIAEHCVNASILAKPGDKLHALLHDASEAYISDIVKPLKEQLPAYKLIEDKIQTVIFKRYRVYPKNSKERVKAIDHRLLHYEATNLLQFPAVDDWIEITHIDNLEIKCLPPQEARIAFLRQFYTLAY